MKKKKHKSIHYIKCEKCGCHLKVFCQLKRGGYSQKALECPRCNYFAGWITSSPGFQVERLISVIQEVVSGY